MPVVKRSNGIDFFPHIPRQLLNLSSSLNKAVQINLSANKSAVGGSIQSVLSSTNEFRKGVIDISELLQMYINEKKNTSQYQLPYNYLVKSSSQFQHWDNVKQEFCNGNFKAFDNKFAMLNDVVLDKSQCRGRPGGEDIKTVLNQDEKEEYYRYSLGFFQLPCDVRPMIVFNGENHLNEWLLNLATREIDSTYKNTSRTWEMFTIAVMRYEYVNLFHTMTDWYNAFLLMQYFRKMPNETHILWIDAHPKGSMDSVWSTLFNSAARLSSLDTRTKFTQLAWNIIGYGSTMLQFGDSSLPLAEEFRQFFLLRHGIDPNARILNCNDLSVLFIWRHDYVAHPRNPQGSVARKIANEDQLIITTRQKFNGTISRVYGVQIDLLDMATQLRLIANTDILVGMHGAGLTHTMFLPSHATLIEFTPYYASPQDHFQSIARWRNLHYETWFNEDPHNEHAGQKTHIPPHVVHGLLRKSMKKMCNSIV